MEDAWIKLYFKTFDNMKSSELNKIMRLLNFPDRFKKKGRLAYYTLTHKTGAIVLVGFYLDNSIDPNSFFVNYFAQCLYVPFCTYNFSLGDRIGSYFLDKIISLRKRDHHNLFSYEIENALFLKDCIEKCNYDKGINQILLWQAQTINGLGLRLSI